MKSMRLYVVLGCLAMLAGVSRGDWPQFLGPNRDGTAVDGKLARSWPAGGPREVWQTKVNAGFGGAAIAGGKVYLLERVGTAQDLLRCLDFATGKEEWSLSNNAPGSVSFPGSRSTPSVDGKCVYTVGTFGQVQGVDLATHAVVWTHNLLTDFDGKLPNWGVTQSPLIYKDWVIVAPQTEQAGVVAYEKATGKLAWKSAAIGSWDTAYASPMLAAVAGQEQVVMLSQASGKKRINVVGLDPAGGAVLWTYSGWKCGIPIPQPVSCGEGRFFVTGGYDAYSALFQVRKEEGKFVVSETFNAFAGDKPAAVPGAPAASNQPPSAVEGAKPGIECSSHFHTPVFYKDCLFANGNSRQKKTLGLVCLGLDGKARWKTGTGVPVELGDVILVDDLLISLSGTGGTLRLVEANPEAYKELASAKVLDQKDQVWAPMAFSDGKLIIHDDSVMKCLDLRGQ